jgi:hypothetical protein
MIKFLLKSLAFVTNRLPKTDWKPIPLCDVYRKYGVEIPNLVGHVSAPSVTTLSASATSTTTIQSGAQMTDSGGENASEIGYCWVAGAGTPTTSDSKVFFTGSFSAPAIPELGAATDLTPNTLYSFRAYAINSGGTGYGSVVTATTHPIDVPYMTTSAATSVSTTSATGNGSISQINGSNVTVRGFVWSASNSTPTTSSNDGIVNASGTWTGFSSYNMSMTGLSPGTFYYYRSYATNSTGTGYGSVQTFTTPDVPTIQVVGQYKADGVTPVSIGGATGTDGVSTNLMLQAEASGGGASTASFVGKLETEQLGTSFDNAATVTTRSRSYNNAVSQPTGKRGGGMVYDDVNKRYIFFGGYDGTTRYNEVWEKYVDTPGQPWRRVTVTGTPPSGRNLFGMTYVKGTLTSGGATRAYAIIWGGADPNDKNDMFALRLDTPGSEAWTTITQTSAPTARSYMGGHVVAGAKPAADQQYIYLFGGWAASRENLLVRCTFDVDTPSSVTWTTLKANGAVGNPSARSGAVMGYKASTNMLYLYGGYTGSAMLSDFWEYNVGTNTWTNTSPTGTAFTGSESMAGGYDATNNRFWVTGGWTTNGSFSTNRNNVGYISNVGGSEAYVEVRAHAAFSGGNQAFAGHSFAGNCVDPERGWLVLAQMASPDSTERYDYIIDFSETATSDFPVYSLADGEYFTARDAMASVYNPDFDEWLNIGGFDDMSDDATITSGTHSGDVWVYNRTTNRWRFAVAGYKALPRMEGSYGVYDTNRKRVLIFGGLTGIQGNANEVWSLTRDAHGNYKAARLRPTGTYPAPTWLGAAAYDEANDRVVWLLGGNSSGPQNGLFSLSFTGGADGAWTTLSPTGTVTNLAGMGYADVKKLKRLYIFGGASNSTLSTVNSQTAYLDYSTTNCTWTQITTSGATARRTPAMSYDAENEVLVVFGGYNGSNVINTTSYFPINNTTWSNAAPGTLPAARRSVIGEFINGRFYITGGRPNTGTWYSDTWELRPDYITPNSSVWTDKLSKNFVPVWFTRTGGSNNQKYHWQAWSTEGSTDSTKVSFGNNTESFTDYYLGTPTPSAPSVTSSAATGIDLEVATANGEVTNDNDGAITERGFVLALQSSGDPTTSTNIGKKVVSGTTGTFSAQFTGLEANTNYKYRPYAINSAGTTYGTAQNFTSADYNTFMAYAVMQNVGGGTTSLVLYNRTDGTEVAGSEMTTTSASPVLVKKQFAYDVTNFADNKEYEFRPKATSGTTANFWSAGLYIKLKELTKATTYNRVSRMGFTALTSAAAATTQRFLYTAANYSSPVVDWIITGTEDGGNGSNTFQLYDVTTTDSGTTGSGVGGTGIDVNSTSKTWATVTGVSLTNNNRYLGIYNHSSGGSRYHQGILGITASGTAGTVETQTMIELLDVARSSSHQKTYEPVASRVPFKKEHFDGATYYFEIVATNSHATNAYGVTLVAYNKDGTATDVVTQNASAATGSSNVRYRTSSITIPDDTVELRVRLAQTAASKNVVLGGARVIVTQTNATKTLVHVPMAGSNVEANEESLNPLVTTTQTSYSALANNVDQFTIWKRDDSKFEVYFDVVTTPQYDITFTTDALKRKTNTRTHTTSSNKKKATTASHTTSSNLVTAVWTYEATETLPANDNLLVNSYDDTDRSNVATNDNVFKDLTGSGFLIEQVWLYHTNNVDEITGVWSGKSTLAPSSSTVYLQIYNHNTDTWTTLDFDSSTAADTEFTLTGSQTDNLSQYYDTGNRVALRVYQEVV